MPVSQKPRYYGAKHKKAEDVNRKFTRIDLEKTRLYRNVWTPSRLCRAAAVYADRYNSPPLRKRS